MFVWLPPYLAVAAVDCVRPGARSCGRRPRIRSRIGLTLPYIRAALVSSFASRRHGLVVVHRLSAAGVRRSRGLCHDVLIFGATPLVWYMVYEPSMTHAASFGFVALFVVVAVRWTSPAMAPTASGVLGALLGRRSCHAPQEALFALVPAALLWTVERRTHARSPRGCAHGLPRGRCSALSPFSSLRLCISAIVFSRESFVVDGEEGYLESVRNRWPDTLWSSWHGFLSWSPSPTSRLIGTAAYCARRRWWAVTALAILCSDGAGSTDRPPTGPPAGRLADGGS